ncbi:MAG: hypothetical protein NTW21_21235 [Verrucomicrobia bacterium]|nr:hypothetical protein [Verrucomicrobiota bacterium]
MKSPISPLAAAMMLPTALLLSQCVPTGGRSPQTIAIPASTRYVQASSTPSLFHTLGTLATERSSAPSGHAPLPTNDRANAAPDGSLATLMAPLVVTGKLHSTPAADMSYWPSSVLDAELKKSWISFKQPDRPKPLSLGI